MLQPKNPTAPHALLGKAIMVLCLSIFVGSLWVPVLDAVDANYPGREEVAEHAAPTDWPLQVAPEGQDSKRVREALAVLSPAYAERVRAFGGQLRVTSKQALARVPVTNQHELTYTAGVYFPEKRTVYIAHDAERPGWTALHELAHLLDHAQGDLSASDAFMRVFEQLEDDTRLDNYARSHPKELFAELFTRYYFSDRRRTHLEERFPQAAEYLANLEQSVLSRRSPSLP